MKAAATNLPTLPTGVRVRKVRGQNKLAIVFVAPQIEKEVAVETVVSAAYVEAAKEIEAGAEALKEVFEPVMRRVARPIAVPYSDPIAAIVIGAKLHKALPKAPTFANAPGHLGDTNRGFSLYK